VRMNPRIVSADRHDRQIDGAGAGSAQLRKRIGQRVVATVPYELMYDAAVLVERNLWADPTLLKPCVLHSFRRIG
jgi:hypothetical protein